MQKSRLVKIIVGAIVSIVAVVCVVKGVHFYATSFTTQTKQRLTFEEMGLREPSTIELEDITLTGLSEHTAKMKISIGEKFDIVHYSLYRQDDAEDHGTGTAVDYMVYSDEKKGNELVKFLTEHMDDLDIKYIIWQQKFYMPVRNIYGPANTWNLMPDRGSLTANHYDHVHVSFNK